MKKIIGTLMIFIFCFSFIQNITYAEEKESFSVISSSDDSFEYKVSVFSKYDKKALTGDSLKNYTIIGSATKGNDCYSFVGKWENPDYIIIEGVQYVNLNCTFKGQEIIIKLYLYGTSLVYPDSDPGTTSEPTRDTSMDSGEDNTSLSLTASKLMLTSASTSYDINVENKETGSSYKWTSSDSKVAKVNSKNGVVTSVSDGEAVITCEITNADGTINELTSIVVVGQDENFPVLNADELELNIGDAFDIDVENKIARSTYKYKSSDKAIVKVNSSNGKLTAVSAGDVYVTCTVTTPDNQVIVLKCDVSVTE